MRARQHNTVHRVTQVYTSTQGYTQEPACTCRCGMAHQETPVQGAHNNDELHDMYIMLQPRNPNASGTAAGSWHHVQVRSGGWHSKACMCSQACMHARDIAHKKTLVHGAHQGECGMVQKTALVHGAHQLPCTANRTSMCILHHSSLVA